MNLDAILSIIAGAMTGWAVIFISWVLATKNARWAWLLCQPWPLSHEKQDELGAFYQ